MKKRAALAVAAIGVAFGCGATFAASASEGTTLLLWPAGPPAFDDSPGGGPGRTVVLQQVGSGRRSIARLPGIAPGDYQPALVASGRWLVYNGAGGVVALPTTLNGSPRLLGRATFFVPAATPDAVWLLSADPTSGYAARVRRVAITSGARGPRMRLPAGTVTLVRGTRRGLLLLLRSGELELWKPGHRLKPLGSVGAAMLAAAGVGSSSHLVAYASGCRVVEATTGFPRTPVGYELCRRLHVVDVRGRELASLPPPRGTLGWVSDGFGANETIAPGDRTVAVKAALPPAAHGKTRLYVIHLGQPPRVAAVPGSTALLTARVAWSPDGSRLFYQGSGERLRTLDLTHGADMAIGGRCCQYAAMVAIRTP